MKKKKKTHYKKYFAVPGPLVSPVTVCGWCKLTTWPQMTFDLGIWPLTTWTYEGSHIISINQVWFQSDFNFSNEAIFPFSACLTTWPQMTFDLDMCLLTSSTNKSSYVASMTQLWLESIKACGSKSQMLTCFHNKRQQQQKWTKWSLCVFPAMAGNTKKNSCVSHCSFSKKEKHST